VKTTLYTVLCIAIRLGAVLMAVGLLESLPVFLWNPGDAQFVKTALAMTAIGLVVALVLWLKPGVLAYWATGRGKGEVLESHIAADQLQSIAFSVLGAWLVVEGLAALLSSTILLAWLRHLVSAYPGIVPPSNAWVGLVRSLVMLVAGVTLMLGARGLVGLLHRVRSYPVQQAIGSDDETAPRD